jgi:hypothetical protein
LSASQQPVQLLALHCTAPLQPWTATAAGKAASADIKRNRFM